ncbi:MAG TPA: TPM domain-containing protein [Woeseiaceae bacterium]|nr:TPM domain-containing protein [Woeseiaceae bacterium]
MHRCWQNLTTTRFALRRAFPPPVLTAIETAIRDSEIRHGGEIQFAIETALDVRDLCRGATARAQACRAFGELGVWDTARNNGVLIYVLLAERDIEIVADRGYRGRVAEEDWRAVCGTMREAYAAGRFLDGSLAGIDAVTALVAAHYPRKEDDSNERPDRPLIL